MTPIRCPNCGTWFDTPREHCENCSYALAPLLYGGSPSTSPDDLKAGLATAAVVSPTASSGASLIRLRWFDVLLMPVGVFILGIPLGVLDKPYLPVIGIALLAARFLWRHRSVTAWTPMQIQRRKVVVILLRGIGACV